MTLGEIAAEMGFENRHILAHPPSLVSSLERACHGVVPEVFPSHGWLLHFASVQLKLSSSWKPVALSHSYGKPTNGRRQRHWADNDQAHSRWLLGFRAQDLPISPQCSYFPDIDLVGTTFLSQIDADFHVSYKYKKCYLEWPEDL